MKISKDTKSKYLLSTLLICSFGLASITIFNALSTRHHITEVATQNAQKEIDFLLALRNYYGKHVFKIAFVSGTPGNLLPKNSLKKSSIPLPDSLLKDINTHLEASQSHFHVYDHETLAKSPKDSFQNQAYSFLKSHPNDFFIQEVHQGDKAVMRVAKYAHDKNLSANREATEGDMIEVNYPISQDLHWIQANALNNFWVSILVLSAIAFTLSYLYKKLTPKPITIDVANYPPHTFTFNNKVEFPIRHASRDNLNKLSRDIDVFAIASQELSESTRYLTESLSFLNESIRDIAKTIYRNDKIANDSGSKIEKAVSDITHLQDQIKTIGQDIFSLKKISQEASLLHVQLTEGKKPEPQITSQIESFSNESTKLVDRMDNLFTNLHQTTSQCVDSLSASAKTNQEIRGKTSLIADTVSQQVQALGQINSTLDAISSLTEEFALNIRIASSDARHVGERLFTNKS